MPGKNTLSNVAMGRNTLGKLNLNKKPLDNKLIVSLKYFYPEYLYPGQLYPTLPRTLPTLVLSTKYYPVYYLGKIILSKFRLGIVVMDKITVM